MDYPAFIDYVRHGRFRAATDMFPVEPVSLDDPLHRVEGLLFSAHRTGGMPKAMFDIGRHAVANAELILKGLPPIVCRKALPEVVKCFRSKLVVMT